MVDPEVLSEVLNEKGKDGGIVVFYHPVELFFFLGFEQFTEFEDEVDVGHQLGLQQVVGEDHQHAHDAHHQETHEPGLDNGVDLSVDDAVEGVVVGLVGGQEQFVAELGRGVQPKGLF